jgi:hypothetical protein
LPPRFKECMTASPWAWVMPGIFTSSAMAIVDPFFSGGRQSGRHAALA